MKLMRNRHLFSRSGSTVPGHGRTYRIPPEHPPSGADSSLRMRLRSMASTLDAVLMNGLGLLARNIIGNNLAPTLAMSAQCGDSATPDNTRRNSLLDKMFVRHFNVTPMSHGWQTLRT